MFSAKQENYWYHFYNVFSMTRSLTGDLPHSKPALSRRRLQYAWNLRKARLTTGPCALKDRSTSKKGSYACCNIDVLAD